MSDDKATRILPGLRAGLTLRQLGEAPRRFHAYCNKHPEYAREALPLMTANAAAAQARKGAHLRATTHCVKGHLQTADNVSFIGKSRRKRQCLTCRRATLGNVGEEIVRVVVMRISEGASRNNLAGRHGCHRVPNKVISFERLNAFIRKNRKIGQWMEKKLAENARKNLVAGIAKRRVHIAAPALARNMGVLEQIEAALTMWLDPLTERPDIITTMWMAIGEGRLRTENIKAEAPRFVREHRRQYTNTGRYAFNSLDAPTSDDNPTSRIEPLTDADRLWWSS
jgi:hypothetical protein